MPDTSHKQTIINAAEAIAKLAELLELPKEHMLVVVPKTHWIEFVNRVRTDAAGLVKEPEQLDAKTKAPWVQIMGIYYVPSTS